MSVYGEKPGRVLAGEGKIREFGQVVLRSLSMVLGTIVRWDQSVQVRVIFGFHILVFPHSGTIAFYGFV